MGVMMRAFRPLNSFFTTPDQLLAADLSRIGEALLVHLNSFEGQVKQHGRLYRGYLLGMLENQNQGLGQRPPGYDYGTLQAEVTRRVMEAWQWLERQGLLVPDPSCNGWHVISTEGAQLLSKLARFENWERYGHDAVKMDLVNGGRRLVGGTSAVKQLAWEWVRMKEDQLKPTAEQSGPALEFRKLSRKVFVVHGHDEAAREKIARFLERLEFEPIILHEQASRGRTVIEKVEAHSDVGFAVVLLTPDDEGCEKGGTPRPRARQNVVLELGYFLGLLGRTHVCAMKRGDLEIPSDFEGVVYVPFDNSDGWKQALGKELQAANFPIDWNRAMGSHA
jgi:predicted nucleotide-binding protein